MKTTKTHKKPNRKASHPKGPYIVISSPDIHDNLLKFGIKIDTVNLGMGSDRIAPTQFPIKDICDSIPESLTSKITSHYCGAYGTPKRRRFKRKNVEKQDSYSNSISNTNREMDGGNKITTNAKRVVKGIFVSLGLSAVGLVAYKWLKKRG